MQASITSEEYGDSLSALIDLIPHTAIIIDATGKILAANKAVEEYTGYKSQELVGKKFQNLSFLDEKDKMPLVENVKRRLNGFSLPLYELKIVDKKGDSKFLEVDGKRIEYQGKPLDFVIFHDITERKKTEQELWQAKIDWERTFNSIPDLIAILDDKHRLVRVNQAMAKALGSTPEKCMGLHCYSCVHGTDSPPCFCPHTKTLQDGQEHIEEVHDERLGGDFLVSTTPLTDEEGSIVGSVHVARNITERKRTEKKLDQYAIQLADAQTQLVKSERLAAIGELAGMVGHDLRNPLTGIKNAAYCLKKKAADAQSKEMLEVIDKCVDYSNKIVNDLLDYSGEVHLELQDSSPRRLVCEALAMVHLPGEVEVLNNLPNEPLLSVDPDKIKRVFINLIKNAVDSMPNGGKLTFNSEKTDGYLEISVGDTGTGIPEEILHKLFLPLFTTKAKGMGFGLAICKRIIETHGGTITVETAKDKGTIFRITLPTEFKVETGKCTRITC